MAYRKLILLFIFCALLSTGFAQQLIFKTYTMQDGLVSNPIRCIFQDSRGFIWIGTWQGLSKYDGHKFTNYTTANGLSDNMINDLYESADGKLYVAENMGVVDILMHDAIIKKSVFSNVLINQFYVTQNKRVIAATDSGGLHEIKNGDLVKPLQKFPRVTYNDIANLNDSFFIAGSETPLFILNNAFEIVSEIIQPKEQVIFKIYKDSKQRVWLGTNYGLKLVSPQQTNILPHQSYLLTAPLNMPVLKNSVVNDIYEDVNGDLWVATTHGLLKMDIYNNWRVFSERDGLPSADIRCVYGDKENNIWIGTSLGLAKLVTKTDINIYTTENGLFANGVGILTLYHEGAFILGTSSGFQLFKCSNKKFTALHTQNLAYGGTVQNSRPLLFYGNDNRFGKYDSANQKVEDYVLPDTPKSEIYCSVMDANGIIFSGTQKGLIVYSKGKSCYANKITHRITFLLIDKNADLWVGTWNNGLYRIHYTKNISVCDQVNFSVEDFSHLLPDKNIRYLFEDSKGFMWVGTRHLGIVRLSINNTGQYTVQRYDLRQGLMSNWVRVISEDAKGCIWIGSNLGLDKLIPADSTYRVFNFGQVNNYFDQINAIIPEENNSLWLATNKGLVNIIDGELEKTPAGPVYITSVKLGDTSFNYNKNYSNAKVELKYFQNQAEFEFSTPGFINEKQIFYSYRLLGSADTTWSKPANLQNVSYASLQPGKYRFEVRTTGWNGEWGVPSNFIFSIRPPYWQTWWFYSIIGIFLVLVFYAFYRYRIKQLLNLQKMRNRIASDLHDDIGATLTNINMLSEISRENLEQPREAEKFLHRISEEVTSTSQALNDIIWSVNSRNDSMQEILARMRRYAAELFDSSNTICHLHLDEAATDKKLSMEQRRDLYLIYKESMNNILKHAKANNVWIHVEWQKGNLYLKIKDDGHGFNPAENAYGNGLKNIHLRTDKWKGKTVIKTVPGAGTSIEIMIPLVK